MSPALVQSVEARRAELESSLSKLQLAIRHWRTWDAEYEGLKEDLSAMQEDIADEEIASLAGSFGGELLTEKEVNELTGLDKGNVRKPHAIVRLIEQRQDYVSQNIATISKQIVARETALDELLDASMPEQPSAGPILPISEIIEELDDDDNVISSKVQRPEDATASILETLRQAGVANLGTDSSAAKAATNSATSPAPSNGTSSTSSGSGSSSQAAHEDTSLTSRASEAGSATVKQEPATGSRPLTESLINGTFRPGDRVIELGDDDEILASGAILPQDESPEDARLRREMLQYHLNEVGNVVAEIDLLEGDDEDDFEDELADVDDDVSMASDISEDEDEHGRNKGPGVSDRYRQEMRDLEQRLMGKMMTNAGPDFSMDTITSDNSPAPVASVTLPERKKPNLKPASSPASGSKSVRFAEELDISPAPEPQPKQAAQPVKKGRPVNTMANTVMERSTNGAATAPSAPKAGKVSRFKQNRQAPSEPEPAPEPAPAQPVLSNTVLERPSAGPGPAPSEEDEFDPELQRRQLAARYYELRNDMIRQQGGFRPPEDEIDDGEGPLMEEGPDGRVRKVSRFKAARLQR